MSFFKKIKDWLNSPAPKNNVILEGDAFQEIPLNATVKVPQAPTEVAPVPNQVPAKKPRKPRTPKVKQEPPQSSGWPFPSSTEKVITPPVKKTPRKTKAK